METFNLFHFIEGDLRFRNIAKEKFPGISNKMFYSNRKES